MDQGSETADAAARAVEQKQVRDHGHPRARVAELPNIVAIKYSVPRPMYTKLTEMVGDKILVSTASEEEWLDNILELGWQLYLCSSPPYLLQTANDRRMHDYTQAAFAADAARLGDMAVEASKEAEKSR